MDKKCRVCHVTSAHGRYDTRIFQKECRSLSQNGFSVFLIVNDKKEAEKIDGVHILSTGIGPTNRMERFIKTKKGMMKLALEVEAQIYHFHDPDLLGLALQLKKNKPSIKIVFDSHEDVPAQILNKEWIPAVFRKIISRCFARYQNIVLKRFDYLVGVTPHLVEKLAKINPHVRMITNYPILLKEENIPKLTECGHEDKAFSFCFAGGISKQWNHHVFLEALENLDARYILCGEGESKYTDALKERVAWDKVDYRGKIPFEKVGEVYQEADVGVALLSYSPNTDYKRGTLGNTKIFEYMNAGLPVICTDFDLWRKIVEENECGICVDPEDVEAVKSAMEYLIQNPETGKEMGKKGKKIVREELNWDVQFIQLKQIYADLLS